MRHEPIAPLKGSHLPRLRGGFNLRSDADTASQRTHIYRSVTDTWEEVQNMTTGRLNNFCGKVTTSSGKEEIVVAGGHGGGAVTDIVEIFSLETETWRTGW